MVTPLSSTLLKWGEIENSLMYCGAAVEVNTVVKSHIFTTCGKYFVKNLHGHSKRLFSNTVPEFEYEYIFNSIEKLFRPRNIYKCIIILKLFTYFNCEKLPLEKKLCWTYTFL